MRPQSLRTDAPSVVSRSETRLVLNEKECVQQRIREKSRELWVMQFSTTEEFRVRVGGLVIIHGRRFPQSLYTLAREFDGESDRHWIKVFIEEGYANGAKVRPHLQTDNPQEFNSAD